MTTQKQDQLKSQIKSLPQSPGIYQYFDKNNKLLYVGKARILKNRVKSYFTFKPNLAPNPKLSARISKMISQTIRLEYIITNSEADALILENSFIKQLNPKYNILLRDDKTYPYIYVDFSEPFPRPQITRKVQKGKNVKYFGPYFKGANELLEALYLNFKLVQKKSCAKGKKACMFYQIDRCHAPCENKITQDQYKKILDDAINGLKNPSTLIPRLEKLMLKYSQSLNFEQAAQIRDKIQTIQSLEVKIEVDLAKLENFEAFGAAESNGLICITRLSVLDGKISGINTNITATKETDENSIQQIYSQAILQAFGKDTPIATNKIYTLDKLDDAVLLEEIISKRHGKKFSIKTPQKGEKLRICQIAMQNAKANIEKYLNNNDLSIEREIQKLFNLNNIPLSIEIFDNSHLFSQASIGAMVRYENGKFIKEHYRHYHLQANNDFDQMRQTLTTRALRFDKLSPPDLWIIDGGDTLLKLAEEIISSSGTNIDIIAISKEKIDIKTNRAKGSARDKIYTKYGKIVLDSNDKRLQFIQKLRDEAHRFAITFHKNTKQKQDIQSSKLAKAGISAGSISKLIKFYGSFDKIYSANFDDIAKITNKSVAEKVRNLKDPNYKE